jgi:hypothetical protein
MADQEIVVALRLIADKFKAELAQTSSGLTGFGGALGKFATDWKTAAGAAVASLGAMVSATAQYAEDMTHLKQVTGIATTTLQEWGVAMNREGASTESLARATKILSEKMVEAKAGVGEGADVFRKLGIAVVDANGHMRNSDDVLLDLIATFEKYKDGANKTALGVQLFGRQFFALLPVFNAGTKAFQDAKDEAHRLSAVLDEDTIKRLDALDDKIDDTKLAFKALTHQIGALIAPLVGPLIDGFKDLIATMAELISDPMSALIRQAIKLNVLFREVGVNVRYLAGGFLLQSFEELKAEIDAIEAHGRKMLADLDAEKALRRKKDTVDARPDAPSLKDNIKEREKTLKDELKLREQQLKEQLHHVKNTASLEESYIKANVKSRILTEGEGAQQITAIHNKEWKQVEANLVAQKDAYIRSHQERIKLGFKDKDAQVQFETEYQEKASQLRQQADSEATAFVKKGIADQESRRVAAEELQAKLGQMFIDEAKTLNAIRKRDLEETVRVEEEKVKAMEASLAAREDIAAQEIKILKAKLALELNDETLTQREIVAIRERSLAQIKEKELEAQGNFLANYLRGIRQYVNDTTTGFGIARQAAIQTAQAMSQAFSQYFFNVFTQQINSMKDLLNSLANLALKVISDVMGQIASQGLLKLTGQAIPGLANWLPGLFGAGGGGGSSLSLFGGGSSGLNVGDLSLRSSFVPTTIPAFASGGIVTRPTLAMVGEGGEDEAIIPLSKLGRGTQKSGDIYINVVNNGPQNTGVQTRQQSNQDGSRSIELLIVDTTKTAIYKGFLDSTLAQNFGLYRRGTAR